MTDAQQVAMLKRLLDEERAKVATLEQELHDCRSLQEHVEGEYARLRDRLFVEIDDARGAGLSGVSFHRIYGATDRLHEKKRECGTPPSHRSAKREWIERLTADWAAALRTQRENDGR